MLLLSLPPRPHLSSSSFATDPDAERRTAAPSSAISTVRIFPPPASIPDPMDASRIAPLLRPRVSDFDSLPCLFLLVLVLYGDFLANRLPDRCAELLQSPSVVAGPVDSAASPFGFGGLCPLRDSDPRRSIRLDVAARAWISSRWIGSKGSGFFSFLPLDFVTPGRTISIGLMILAVALQL